MGGLLVYRQKAPWVLGEVSPTLAWPKAAMKGLEAFSDPHFSKSCAAVTLLSPLMRVLVLLMDVQCTGNQVSAPRLLQPYAPQATKSFALSVVVFTRSIAFVRKHSFFLLRR